MTRRLLTPTNIWLTGASSGIGEALAHELARHGHKLVVTGRRQHLLEALAAHYPGQIEAAAADATNAASLAEIRPALECFGPLSMVILNAGTCEYLDITDYDSQVIEKNLETNVMGAARCLDIGLPALRAARANGLPATLVIVSSSAWWLPFTRAEGYGASKAALTYFARALRADLAAEGIDVVVVSPGFVKTPLTDRNDFPMPFMIAADEACRRIRTGLERGQTEIAFPRRFTWMLKTLSALPQPVIDRMAASMARKGNL